MEYFIDSILGSDLNDGSSRQTAFKSLEKMNSVVLSGGDKVFLKAGCEFNGNLTPKRTKGEDIIVFDRYGVGEKPKILPNGGNGIDLCDIEEIEIHNMAIHNPNGLRGIYIHNESGGELRHIYITNCDIENVNGEREPWIYESGGIIMGAFSDQPSWFNDVLIQDNTVTDVCKTGIFLTTFWAMRPVKYWGKNEYIDDEHGWYPSRNMVIRGNKVVRTAGDGIVLIGVDKPLFEWNTVYEAQAAPKPPCANAGLWPQASNGAIIQYNEVAYCHKPDGCHDAQGYDVDLSCKNTIIQYNYSHDNEGGFLLLCDNENTMEDESFSGTVVRNNLSVNDGQVKGEVIAIVGPVHGVVIENNTICSTGNVDRLVEVFSFDNKNYARDFVFRNNIFIADGKNNTFNLKEATNFAFDSNLYWGEHKAVPVTHKNPVVADPQFCDDCSSGDGRLAGDHYIPSEHSVVLQNGLKTETVADTDYYGNSVIDKTYIGAIYKNRNQ